MKTKTKTKRSIEAAKLEAQAKAIRRQEKAFWQEVEERIDEVKERFGISDIFDDICRAYDCNSECDKKALLDHITSDNQITYFHRIHPMSEDTNNDDDAAIF